MSGAPWYTVHLQVGEPIPGSFEDDILRWREAGRLPAASPLAHGDVLAARTIVESPLATTEERGRAAAYLAAWGPRSPLWETLRLAHAGQADVAGLASSTPSPGEAREDFEARRAAAMVESMVATAQAVGGALDGEDPS